MDPLSPAHINAGWDSTPSSPVRTLDPGPSVPSPISSTSQSHAFNHPSSSLSSPIREPKVFGAPGMGLVSPPSPPAGASKEKQRPFLRVRIGALERNRKDLLIRFDASTNLPNFRTGLYKNMQRSYVEFQRFAEQAQLSCPHTIIPALPLASTSALTDEEDDRLVRITLQRWFTRICEDPVLLKDDELRNFVESDFGYQPVPPPSSRRPMSTASAVPNVLSTLAKVVRRGPLDEDDELQAARITLEKLEERWGGAATSVGGLGRARRALALANADVGAKLISLSTVESDPTLAGAERKIGRAYEQLSGIGGAQASSENVVLSDTLGYQALNARAAKDALIQRTAILEDSQSAIKNAINKRRNVERMKGSSNINPAKVDDAIAEMEEANSVEAQLTSRLSAISNNLHTSLKAHSRNAHEDVALALLENARLTVNFHKHTLRELEALRPDLARVGTNAPVPVTPAAPAASSSILPPPSNKSLPHAPVMTPSKSYQPPAPPLAQVQDGSKSLFLPPANGPPGRPSSAGPIGSPHPSRTDPLGGHGLAQSMMLPHQVQQPQRAQTLGRAGGRRLDERQAAKLLANGF